MILLAHMLLGAVVGYYTKNIYLAIMLALLCHYFLDLFPHIEYDIKNIKEKKLEKITPRFFKGWFGFFTRAGAYFCIFKKPTHDLRGRHRGHRSRRIDCLKLGGAK